MTVAGHALETAARPSPNRLVGLDILRGIAALCVFQFHLVGIYRLDAAFLGKGYLAVDFFFMLSGYVIARTYEQRLREGFGAWRLMVSRYRRLCPIMAIGVLCGAPMLALEYQDFGASLSVVLPNMMLIPSVTRNILYPANSAAWSVLAELVVNLLHGLLLWRLRTRHLVLLAAATALPVIWIARSHDGLSVGANTAGAYLGIICALLPYTMGVIFYRRWRDRPSLRIPPALAFAAMPVAIVVVPITFETYWTFDLAVVLFASPLLIAGGLAYRGAAPIGRWLGDISFPLYAVNLPLLHLFHALGVTPAAATLCIFAVAALITLRLAPAGRGGSVMTATAPA